MADVQGEFGRQMAYATAHRLAATLQGDIERAFMRAVREAVGDTNGDATDVLGAAIDLFGGLSTITDLANRWDVPPARVRRIARRSDFPEPAAVIGGRPVYATADCESWRHVARREPRAPNDRVPITMWVEHDDGAVSVRREGDPSP